jgi:hypothetical protein
MSNACGNYNTGTILCGGSCNAVTPANPPSYNTACNSASNACGAYNTGTINCAGSCSVSTPALPPGYNTACAVGIGECQRYGVINCAGVCSVTPWAPGVENTAGLCNDGRDNDCDGLTDCADSNCQGININTTTCDTGWKGVCASGTQYRTCSGGTWTTTTCTNIIPASAEVCDGLDNDCSGTVDDSWQTMATRPYNSNQIGVCAGSKKQCSGISGWTDWFSVANFPNYISPETSACDGFDNDKSLIVM